MKGLAMFKKTVIAGLTAAALGSGIAQAQQPPASPHTLTGNIGFFSQDIFRGLTQTNGEPAFQGGFDYSPREWLLHRHLGAPISVGWAMRIYRRR